MKEYVWHNYVHSVEEVSIDANSFEEAEKKFLDGEGHRYWLESHSERHECIKNADDFEDDEEDKDE